MLNNALYAGVAAAMLMTAGGAMANDLKVAVQAVPASIDPASENSNVSLRVIYSVYDTLVKTDFRDGGKLKPALATAWKVIDAKTVEFKLRPDVKFHNGETLSADDIVATFSPVRIGLDPNVPLESKAFLGGIDRVEVIDPLTVRIHMKKDDAIALQRFANFPSQIISAVALKNSSSYQEFAEKAVGTGPYKLKSFKAGDKVVLEKFDAYWGEPKAAAEEVTFTVVPELSTRIAGLVSGQFDLITEVGPDDIKQIDSGKSTKVVGGPILNILGLFYDSTNDVLADPRIRQALNLSIDRVTLVNNFYGGRTEVPNGWQMPSFGDMYLADRPLPEYNVAKAKALLKEAGYNGAEIVYRTRNYYTKQIETSQILQSMWKAAGLNVKLEIKENAAQVFADDDRRMIVDGSFSAYYPDPLGQFWRRFGQDTTYATGKYWKVDPEMVSMGDDLATSIDTAHRREIFGKMLDKFNKEPNGAVLYDLAAFMGERSDRISLDVLPNEYLDLTTDGLSFK